MSKHVGFSRVALLARVGRGRYQRILDNSNDATTISGG